MPATSHERMLASVDVEIAAVEAELLKHRHHLHQQPELSNRERLTEAYVLEVLESVGITEVRSGLAGHGVVAILRGRRSTDSEHRTVALRADMDALPVRETSGVDYASTRTAVDAQGFDTPVAHACGHDCHMAVVLASARVLAQVRDELPGDVVFVFQPAEEGAPAGEYSGAQALVDTGVFDGIEPTMVFGMHVSPLPRGTVGVRSGVQFAASTRVEVAFTGVGTHAAMPWLGEDPLLPAAGTLLGAQGLARRLPPGLAATVTFGHVEDQGRYNIIGAEARLHGTIRCVDDDSMTLLKSRLRQLSEAQAQSYGCTARVDFTQDVPALTNDAAWLDAAIPTLQRAVGAEQLVPAPLTLGYDDMSALVRRFGGLYLLFGVQDTVMNAEMPDVIEPVPDGRGLVPNHHPAFYADDASLLASVRVHCHVAVDHLFSQLVPARA